MGWNHSQCWNCFKAEKGNDAEPCRVIAAKRLTCCYCGVTHASGIFRRENPASPLLKCEGKHDEEA